METKTQEKNLTTEELKILREIQNETQQVIQELGEIELIRIQTENRYNQTKEYLQKLSEKEIEFSKSIQEKYGEVSLNLETGEINSI